MQVFEQNFQSYLQNTIVSDLKFCTPKLLTKWHMQTVQTQVRLLPLLKYFKKQLHIKQNRPKNYRINYLKF